MTEPDHIRTLEFEVLPQPDDTTCGPTCLHAVYRYFNDPISLPQVIAEVPPLPGGGTLGVWLACHALRRGYDAAIYTYNLQLFDPTWFDGRCDIAEKLRQQATSKHDPKLLAGSEAYIDFFELGGSLHFEPLTSSLVRRFLKRGIPILTGLSATYLYGCARETWDYDDVHGEPQGHFVVLSGYDRQEREVMVADPLHDNPRYGGAYYRVGMDRLLGAILLGILTYDANLMIIAPRQRHAKKRETPHSPEESEP